MACALCVHIKGHQAPVKVGGPVFCLIIMSACFFGRCICRGPRSSPPFLCCRWVVLARVVWNIKATSRLGLGYYCSIFLAIHFCVLLSDH
jgi:hypothetical protein